MKTVFTSLITIFLSITLHSQITLSGKVVSLDEELIGASVIVKGTDRGTSTDLDGGFSITIDSLPVTLVFSYTGFTTQEVKVKSAKPLSITLDEGDFYHGCPLIIIKLTPVHITIPTSSFRLQKREIKRDHDLSFAPILNRIPGIYTQTSTLNNNQITMRGVGNRSLLSTSKIRAYLDDIPLTTGDGKTSIEDIDLSLINKTNVWRGPSGSIYGAGLGGVIHLQTIRNVRYNDQNNFETKTTVGSYGLFRNASNFSLTNEKETVSFNINYNYTHSDGYRENSQYDRQGITLLGKVKSNSKHQTTILANYTDVKAFIPGPLNKDEFDNTPQMANDTWETIKGFEDYDKVLLGIAHHSHLKKFGYNKLANTTSLFGNFRKNHELRPTDILEEESRSIGFRSSFVLDKQGKDYADHEVFPKYSLGIELFNENYDWKTFHFMNGMKESLLSDHVEKRNYINLFLQTYQELFENINLLAGINLNHTHYDYKDQFTIDSLDLSGDYSFNWMLSPQVGLNYLWGSQHSIFASVSHGFSPPTLTETFTPSGVINPNIQPEQGWNFEMGTKGQIFRRFAYELTLYQMRIKNLLVNNQIGLGQFTPINAGRTRHNGIETYLEFDILRGKQTLTAYSIYNYSHYKFIDFIDEGNDYSGNQLTGTPPHNLSLGVDYYRNGFYGNINFHFVDAFPIRDDNSESSDAYHVMNLKIGYRRTLFYKFELNVFGGIRNLWNEKYASMILINANKFNSTMPRYFHPGLPRNFFGGISFKYYFYKL